LYATVKEDFELIVVDGNSTDGTRNKIKNNFPDAYVIKLDRPYWISYAWNVGLEKALSTKAKYIGILNNDLVFDGDWLTPILDTFDDLHVGMVSPLQVDLKKTQQTTGRNRIEYADYSYYVPKNSIIPFTWVVGFCFFLRREAVEQIGGFDEQFFFGGDEVDYCLRLWARGWKVVCNSYSEVMHHKTITLRETVIERRKELEEIYGVEYIHPRKYFYEKYSIDFLDSVYKTIKAEQDNIGIELAKKVDLTWR